MGRRSKAEDKKQVAKLQHLPRAEPPEEALLGPEEMLVWKGVVEAQPYDWFDASNAPLLVQYCRHVVAANKLYEVISAWQNNKDEYPVGVYTKFLQAQRQESVIILQLATKMRIAQQSLTNHRGNKQTEAVAPPWEQDE